MPVVRTVVDFDEPDRTFDLVGGLCEVPSAVLGSIRDLNHRCSVHSMVAVKKEGVVCGVGEDSRGLIEQVRDRILRGTVVGASVVDDWNMKPFDAEFRG